MLKSEGFVRRMDLNLKTRFIGIKTEIYKTSDHTYSIYCINYSENFTEVSNVFDNEIKYIGYNVKLSTTKPDKYIKIIEGISLDNVVDGFKSTCVTMADIENLIRNRFYDVNVVNISTPNLGIEFELLVEVSFDTSVERIKSLKKFLLDSEIGTDKITVKRAKEITQRKDIFHQDNKYLKTYSELPFTKEETEIWYESAEDIYSGKIKRNDSSLFRANTTKCLLDFSMFDNINLRKVLLLYDTVYICIPTSNKMDDFLQSQGMTIKDFLELAYMGKIVMLLTYDESMYDKELIIQAYTNSKLNVIGRRGINTLLATYLAETKLEYEKKYPGIYDIASNIFIQGFRTQDINLQNIGQIIAWPFTATAESFSILNQYSPISMGDFGFNSIFGKLSDKKSSAINFEFFVNSLNIQLASALQATYFPFQYKNNDGTIYSDSGVSKIWGDLLKIYRYNANSLQDIKNIQEVSRTDYIQLFESKDNISVTKVALLADEYNTPQKFTNLLSRLGNMSDEARKKEIVEFNDIIYDLSNNHQKKSVAGLLLGASGFLKLPSIISCALTTIGLTNDIVGGTELIRNHKEIEKIKMQLKNSGKQYNSQKIEDIYLLDKISRVAMIK